MAVSPVVIVNSVAGIDGGVYVLDRRYLREVGADRQAMNVYSKLTGGSLGQRSMVPAVIVALVCNWEAVANSYQNCTLVTGLWDAGVLLQTMSLSASSQELPSCISAVVPPTEVQAKLGINTDTHGIVGTFTVGGASDDV
ncbi:hypothetical protein [Arthrobacter sp. CG_A4]|uniref:hypothetical protein n=1 Tax=Arthrobacter sp. CG_A4 TaxID=3071706 RepID=UPI002DFB028B|nr:hypothetical protein [Arthrobacter sp. CG_A4]